MKKLYPFRCFTILAVPFLAGVTLVSSDLINIRMSIFEISAASILLVICSLFNNILKNTVLSIISLAIFSFILGVIYGHVNKPLVAGISTGMEVEISGRIVEKPVIDYKSQNIILAAEEVNGEKHETFFISIKLSRFPSFHHGDNLRITGTFKQINALPDYYQRSLKAKKVTAILENASKVVPQPPSYSAYDRFKRSLYAFSDQVTEVFERTLAEPHSSLAAGLLFGASKSFPDDFMDSLSAAGLTHIVALSGYNITIIIFIIFNLTASYLKRKWNFLLTLLLILVFVIMTGASASVVRAAIFSILLLLGKIAGRKADYLNILLLTCILMVLENTNIILNDLSFELSFLAFAGLIYLSPVIRYFIEKVSFINNIGFIKIGLVETLSAQLAVLPLILGYFGNLSLVAPLANVAVLWALPLAMLFSAITGIAGLIFMPLGKLISLLLWPMLQFIVSAVNIFAKTPFGSFKLESQGGLIIIFLYLLIITVTILLYKKYKLHENFN